MIKATEFILVFIIRNFKPQKWLKRCDLSLPKPFIHHLDLLASFWLRPFLFYFWKSKYFISFKDRFDYSDICPLKIKILVWNQFFERMSSIEFVSNINSKHAKWHRVFTIEKNETIFLVGTATTKNIWHGSFFNCILAYFFLQKIMRECSTHLCMTLLLVELGQFILLLLLLLFFFFCNINGFWEKKLKKN